MEYTEVALDSPFVRQMSPEFFWFMFFIFAAGSVWVMQKLYSRLQPSVLVQGEVIPMHLEKFGKGRAVFGLSILWLNGVGMR